MENQAVLDTVENADRENGSDHSSNKITKSDVDEMVEKTIETASIIDHNSERVSELVEELPLHYVEKIDENKSDNFTKIAKSDTAEMDENTKTPSITDHNSEQVSEMVEELSPHNVQEMDENLNEAETVTSKQETVPEMASSLCDVPDTPEKTANSADEKAAEVGASETMPEFQTIVVKIENANDSYGDNTEQDNMGYRQITIADAGSSEDSDSDSSSDESSSSEHEVEQTVLKGSEPVQLITKIKVEPLDSDNEELGGNRKIQRNKQGFEDVRTKGELMPENLPKIEDLKITVDDSVLLTHMGNVSSVVGVLVVVKGNRELPPLNEDTILFFENRHAIGAVFEIFGPVVCPWYSIRFNAVSDIEEREICVGMRVYCAPKVDDLTRYVFVDSLRKMKGTDASWENNNEPPVWCQEFSDDEDEKRAKAKRKGKNTANASNGESENTKAAKQRNNQNRKMKQRDNTTMSQHPQPGRATAQNGFAPQRSSAPRMHQFPPRSPQGSSNNSYHHGFHENQDQRPRPSIQYFPPPSNQEQTFRNNQRFSNPRASYRIPPPLPQQNVNFGMPPGASPPHILTSRHQAPSQPRPRFGGSCVWPPRLESSQQFGQRPRPLPPRDNSSNLFYPQSQSQLNPANMFPSRPPFPPRSSSMQPVNSAPEQYMATATHTYTQSTTGRPPVPQHFHPITRPPPGPPPAPPAVHASPVPPTMHHPSLPPSVYPLPPMGQRPPGPPTGQSPPWTVGPCPESPMIRQPIVDQRFVQNSNNQYM